MKNKRSSEGGSQKVEYSRAKRKSSTETLAPVDCIFCRGKKGICQKCQKSRTVPQIHAVGEYHISFQSLNVQHVEFLTEQWRKIASLLGNTDVLSKLHTEVRANKPQ